MANLGLVTQELNGLPANLRPVFLRIFQGILRSLRFGHPTGDDPDPSENFGGGFYSVTTHATPGSEFTIAHGFGRAPYLLIPVLPLDVVNAELVPLTVSRAADERRIYLTSSVASAPLTVYVEG